jgi:cytochrome c-550 PedF
VKRRHGDVALETILGHMKETGLMTQLRRLGAMAAFVASVLASPQSGLTHGDVTPQPMETKGLLPLGEEWLSENPYRGNPLAIKLGEHGYTQNCARCHGIDAISGGLSPDLRYSERGAEGDEIYIEKTRRGIVRNGAVYMPKFEGILSQEAMWAIRSWLDTKAASADDAVMTAAAPEGSAGGQTIYTANCAMCHQVLEPKLGDKAAWERVSKRGEDALVASVIGGKGAMPPRAGKPALSDSDIKAAVEYMGSAAK